MVRLTALKKDEPRRDEGSKTFQQVDRLVVHFLTVRKHRARRSFDSGIGFVSSEDDL